MTPTAPPVEARQAGRWRRLSAGTAAAGRADCTVRRARIQSLRIAAGCACCWSCPSYYPESYGGAERQATLLVGGHGPPGGAGNACSRPTLRPGSPARAPDSLRVGVAGAGQGAAGSGRTVSRLDPRPGPGRCAELVVRPPGRVRPRLRLPWPAARGGTFAGRPGGPPGRSLSSSGAGGRELRLQGFVPKTIPLRSSWWRRCRRAGPPASSPSAGRSRTICGASASGLRAHPPRCRTASVLVARHRVEVDTAVAGRNGRRFISIGRLVHDKNVDVLLQALAERASVRSSP